MDVIHHKEYHVRNLSTRSVTLFPSRAQIVRELKSLPLSPGTNEITIIGLTPTVDESTIKVDGTGSAVITDIAVELLPNRDIFEDIYPDSSDDASDAESDHDENVDEPPELPELSNLRSRLRQLRDEERRSKEFVESAASRLKILDAYGKSLDRKKSIDIVESIETYRTERERIFQDHAAGLAQGQANAKLLSAALKEESRLMKKQEREAVEAARERERARKERAKEKQKDAKRREERRREKERIRKERESFWPRVCYSVRVTLEAATLTPMSSRRTSVSSDTVQAFAATTSKSIEGSELLCDLSLSYVTSAASWSPSYDLQLFTTNNSGTLCYDARITNETSETWSNCKVILSTSQALFSGLENSIPTLKPWNIKLAPKNGQGSDILDSAEERLQRRGWWSVQQRAAQTSKPRSQLFGASRKMSAFTAKQDSENEDYRRQEEQNTMEWPVMPSLDENVDFQESTVEETGFTTTYDLPGTKTLPPRPTPSKQRVARVGFSNIVFSHTVVAKYKPVAYLKAKIRNNSRLTLLRGETGLTLDGTFLGRARLPLCSDGDMFSLGLGVDPAIKVNYPKVDVRRTTTGLFSKENSSVYTRSITVANTRAAAGKPVSLFVLDQVPVSEDERLKVDVLAPKGLVVNGASVATGRPAREGKDDADWGKATALLRKGGQVDWQVTLNAGKAVKLGLEYVVALPSGDSAVEC
ncbi:mucoidy inhibitor-like protein [Colletotrichum higginsianum]|nr:mucoidy inhibitor-like protein [Colletotrichum higginsianum]